MLAIIRAAPFPNCRYLPRICKRHYRRTIFPYRQVVWPGIPLVSMSVEIACWSKPILVWPLSWMALKERFKTSFLAAKKRRRVLRLTIIRWSWAPTRGRFSVWIWIRGVWYERWKGTRDQLVPLRAIPNTHNWRRRVPTRVYGYGKQTNKHLRTYYAVANELAG